MRNCKQITRLISDAQERPLTFFETLELKFHLSMCSACKNFDSNVQHIHRAMQAFNTDLDKKP